MEFMNYYSKLYATSYPCESDINLFLSNSYIPIVPLEKQANLDNQITLAEVEWAIKNK